MVQVYNYAQRPKGKTREQVDIAVDSLARISIGAQLAVYIHLMIH